MKSKPGRNPPDKGIYAYYGVGFPGDISHDTIKGASLELCGEIGARRGWTDLPTVREPVDYVVGLGLQYNWGGKIVIPPPADSDGDGVPDNMDKCPGTPKGDRAATFMKYLADKGVSNAVTSRGYGERQPVASNKTAEGMQQNRRVVLRVLN